MSIPIKAICMFCGKHRLCVRVPDLGWLCLDCNNGWVAEQNAQTRTWNVVGGFPEEEDPERTFNDPPEISEQEKREDK